MTTEGQATQTTNKRFSVPRQANDRRVVVRPYESFRERGPNTQTQTKKISFGYASLNAEYADAGNTDPAAADPELGTAAVFSIYGEEGTSGGTSVVFEQPVGAEADAYINSLTDKQKGQLRRFLENTPRQEFQYFVWIKEQANRKLTVISLKTIENHLKSEKKVQRVKWRHLSTERVSIYRYSIPAITYQKSKACGDCILRHKKICLIMIWLAFVCFLCVVVLLGSINHEELHHPYLHMRNLTTPR